MAAFWEYARESQLIKVVRSEYVLWRQTFGHENARHCREDQLAQRSRNLLLLVTSYPFFPYVPFEQIIKNDLFSYFYTALGFDSSHVYCFPLQRAEEFRHRFELEGYTLYCIAIPWTRTNPELAKMFEQELQSLRPASLPPLTVHPGRRGRCLDSGATDKLNQLIAFRLRRAGLSFDQARSRSGSLMVYTSERGWNKAAAAAEDRIKHMLVRPLVNS